MSAQATPVRWASVAIFIVVLGTAIYTGNAGLFALTGVCAAAIIYSWRK